MGRRAQLEAARHFDQRDVTRTVERIYQAALGLRAGPERDSQARSDRL